MPKAAIFDVDGTLIDSVDLHAMAWHDAMIRFGHDVSFEQARSQIGKGGDKLIPAFLSKDEQRDHGKELDSWRSEHLKARYLTLVRPFSAVPDLLRRSREAGLRIAVASSAKKDELDQYLDIAGVQRLVDVIVSFEEVDESKPAPDIFVAVLKKLGIEGRNAVAIGDTPYDAEAAGKPGIGRVGVLCGGFTEDELRKSGCAEVYPGPAALLACFERSTLVGRGDRHTASICKIGDETRAKRLPAGPLLRSVNRNRGELYPACSVDRSTLRAVWRHSGDLAQRH